MKKLHLIIIFALVLAACHGNRKTTKDNTTNEAVAVIENEVTEKVESSADEIGTEEGNIPVGGLNAIRFEGWTDKDWLDNDYIRALRTYVDAYCRGEIKNPELDKYKSIMQSKFTVLNIEPYIAGGAFITIVFLDNPQCVFESGVHSKVDDNNRVSDYSAHGLKLVDTECPLTKEDILEIIKEHPENKLW